MSPSCQDGASFRYPRPERIPRAGSGPTDRADGGSARRPADPEGEEERWSDARMLPPRSGPSAPAAHGPHPLAARVERPAHRRAGASHWRSRWRRSLVKPEQGPLVRPLLRLAAHQRQQRAGRDRPGQREDLGAPHERLSQRVGRRDLRPRHGAARQREDADARPHDRRVQHGRQHGVRGAPRRHGGVQLPQRSGVGRTSRRRRPATRPTSCSRARRAAGSTWSASSPSPTPGPTDAARHAATRRSPPRSRTSPHPRPRPTATSGCSPTPARARVIRPPSSTPSPS